MLGFSLRKVHDCFSMAPKCFVVVAVEVFGSVGGVARIPESTRSWFMASSSLYLRDDNTFYTKAFPVQASPARVMAVVSVSGGDLGSDLVLALVT